MWKVFEDILKVFWRSSEVCFALVTWDWGWPGSIWCEALSFVLLFWWSFGLILELFPKTWQCHLKTFDFWNLGFCCKLRWRGMFKNCFEMLQIWICSSQTNWIDWKHEMSAASCSGGLPKILWSVRAISLVSEEYMVRSTLLRSLVSVVLRADFGAFPKNVTMSFENLWFLESGLLLQTEMKRYV